MNWWCRLGFHRWDDWVFKDIEWDIKLRACLNCGLKKLTEYFCFNILANRYEAIQLTDDEYSDIQENLGRLRPGVVAVVREERLRKQSLNGEEDGV